MKKVFIALGILLVIAGIIIVAIFGRGDGLANIVNAFKHDLTAVNESKTIALDGTFSELDVMCDTYSVYVRKAQVPDIVVSWIAPVKDDVSVNVFVDDGSLKVVQTGREHFVSFGNSKEFLLIELPEVFNSKNCTVDVKIGSIDFNGIDNDIIKDLYCNVQTGANKISDCSFNSVSLRSDTGAIKVVNSSVKDVHLYTATGAVEVSSVTGNSLNVASDTGALTVKDSVFFKTDMSTDTGAIKFCSQTNELNMTANTGPIYFETAAERIFAETDTGSVSGKVKGLITDYNIIVKQDTGHKNIDNQTVDSNRILSVTVDTGRITVNFVG